MKNLSKIFTVALLLVATFVAQAQRPRVWTVTNAGDGAAGTIGGAGTFRNTIAAAVSGDTIQFSPLLNNVTILLNSTIVIDKSITIIGNGQALTIIRVNATSHQTPALEFAAGAQHLGLSLNIEKVSIDGLFIHANSIFTLTQCNLLKNVFATSPRSFNLTDCNFTSPTPFSIHNFGAVSPIGSRPYQISRCHFTNTYDPANPLNFMGVYLIKSSNPVTNVEVVFTECEFKNNTTGYGAIFCIDIDNIQINKCIFDENKAVQNSSLGASAICMQGKGTPLIMNSIFRANGSYNNVNNNNLIFVHDWTTPSSKIEMYQNQITGNSGADIRIQNHQNNSNLILRQNTIANNSSAVMTATNLQVANSYLQATFNTVNTPVSLGGNYFRNPVAWAISSDILYTIVSFPATQPPVFVAPATSIPSTGGNYRLAANSILIGGSQDAYVPQDIFDYNSNGNFGETVPFDIVGNPRRFNRGVDIGAYERQSGGGGLRAENGEETLTNNPQTVVYPNPANEVLNINFELSTGAEKAEIAIFNTIGQVVYQNTVNAESKSTKVDVSNFEKGLYVIKIVDNQGNTQNQKVLVQ
jgi:hypothetical protein